MPNHITNRLVIKGEKEEVNKVLHFIKIEKEYDEEINGIGTIDFNKITPMPKWIYGSSPDVHGISTIDEEKYGKENTCIAWARKNWGTKWNAYSQPDDRNTENTIYFQTAWKGIPELIQKIAWIFPNVEIEYSWCDEDFGYNLGRYRFKDTEILEEYLPDGGSKDAYELGLEIEQCKPEEKYMRFNHEIDNYEYFDDEE
ncbi:hypothetical protein [Clostridium tetani]|uniref:DUF1281 family ferredoxin-like fold protein n=1 Tax=Clostridium tetani TaxID=1513 RepID=UPI001025C9CA|nr:hypothetical protein [Clostridium tetani]RXI70517.1 hypothetical protein DP127_09475 [Clostridium tetani]